MTLILPPLLLLRDKVTSFNSFPILVPVKVQHKAKCCDALPSFGAQLGDAQGLGCLQGGSRAVLQQRGHQISAQPRCSVVASGPAGSTQGQLCRDPRRRQAKCYFKAETASALLKVLQNKDPPNPLSSRCKKWIGTKGLFKVTTTQALWHFAGVGKQKTAPGDTSLGMRALS